MFATSTTNPLFLALLKARGLSDSESQTTFLKPDYQVTKHDPFLLPDMKEAVERLAVAKKRQEKVVIYGDYDIDGLTATSLLMDAFKSFGISADSFIPNRFSDGYGLSRRAIEDLAADGAEVIITVDCGSLSHDEIARANELGVDVIVTDHHSVSETMPPAVAVINPKRPGHDYPFIDLAGVGVAFKLVQALQQRLPGLPEGQEKWLLDLVALGTVCDVVELRNENRTNVYWGLNVIAKTRRPGLRALMAICDVEPAKVTARTLGFVLGPRLNASGRLETAKLSLDLLTATDNMAALKIAGQLDAMNKERRKEQDRIFKEACELAEQLEKDPVLILSHPGWSHGIVGIVAAKLMERYRKPVFLMQELGQEAKGSARSYGDFSAVDAIRACEEHLIKGGGHKLAAGVTLKTESINNFKRSIINYYKSLGLKPQAGLLDPQADVTIDELNHVNEELIKLLERLQPYGHGNSEPIFCFDGLSVVQTQYMGDNKQHIKIYFIDKNGLPITTVAFNMAHAYNVEPGEVATIWTELYLNEWRGRRSIEGRLKKLVLN